MGTVLVSLPASGAPGEDKQRIDRQLAKASAALETATARARAAGALFARATQALPGAEEAVQRSRGEVAAAQVTAADAARVAARTRGELAAAQAVFDARQRAVEQARSQLEGFVRASYEGGPVLATSAMLGATSPEQFIAGLNYLGGLAGHQKQVIDEVTRVRLIAAQTRADVAERKRLADAADAEAKASLDRARRAQEDAERAKRHVVDLVDQRKQALAVAQQEKAASAEQQASLREESRRISAALRDAANRSRGGWGAASRPRMRDQGGSRLSQPVDGWRSSDFGYRFDPYYNIWQLHAGADYAAPGGSAIRASAGGVVVRAGWNGGYGRYTCIYHHELFDGRGLSTCYAHQSRIGVFVGEHVGRGEVIGEVGTTGASTGNHLHFEVRIDGEPVNPLGWL